MASENALQNNQTKIIHSKNTCNQELPKTPYIHSPCKKQNFRLGTNYSCSTLFLYLLLAQGHVARFSKSFCELSHYDIH